MRTAIASVDKPFQWRLWHSGNFLFGGLTFVAGSILLFPDIDDTNIINEVSIWFYIVGSFTLLLADITELLHYLHDWRYLNMIIIQTFNSVSTFLYLVGSILLLPEVNRFMTGMDLFIVGSFLLTIAQLWKIAQVFKLSKEGFKAAWNQFRLKIVMLSISSLGGLIFIIGTYVFMQVLVKPSWERAGAWMFTLGSVFFLIPAIYVVKIYFFTPKRKQIKLISQIQL